MVRQNIGVLTKYFTPWKLAILYLLGKNIKDIDTPFPYLSSEKFSNNRRLRDFLEELVNAQDFRSLKANYYNNLDEFSKDDIIKKKHTEESSKRYSYKFTEIGLRVAKFFVNVMDFFDHKLFLEMFKENKVNTKNRSKVFIDILARLVKISTYFNLKKENIPVFLGLYPHLEEPINSEMLRKLIKTSVISFGIYPNDKSRRERLNNALENSFKYLLGPDLNKMKIKDFKELEAIFNEWQLISDTKYYFFPPPEGFEIKISKILNYPNPTYAYFNERKILEFCSENLEEVSKTSSIIYDEEFIRSVSNLYLFLNGFQNILSISKKEFKFLTIIPQPNFFEYTPKINLLDNNKGFLLFTCEEPLCWPVNPQELKFFISLSKEDEFTYIFKKDNIFKLIKNNISNDFTFFKVLIKDLNICSEGLLNFLSRNIFNTGLNQSNHIQYYHNINLNTKDLSSYFYDNFTLPILYLYFYYKNYIILFSVDSNRNNQLVMYYTKNKFGSKLSKIDEIILGL